VSRVTQIIGEISTGVQTQTQSLGEVNTAVGQLDTMTVRGAEGTGGHAGGGRFTLPPAPYLTQKCDHVTQLHQETTKLTVILGSFRVIK
jgi:methyl-accepting chemotaxis protein